MFQALSAADLTVRVQWRSGPRNRKRRPRNRSAGSEDDVCSGEVSAWSRVR